MKLRFLIGKSDGVKDRDGHAFMPGSITPTKDVPILKNFDLREPPIGRADIEVDGTDVYAVLDLPSPLVESLWPALGGRPRQIAEDGRVTAFDVLSIGFCDGPNSDERIPRIDSDLIDP